MKIYSRDMFFRVALVVFSFVTLISCTMENKELPLSENQVVLNQYKVDEGSNRYSPDGVCKDFGYILNPIPYQELYEDIFLNSMDGKFNFSKVNFRLVSDGEKKYGSIPIDLLKIKNKENALEKKVFEFNDRKRRAGGFEYYIAHEKLFDDGVNYPILFIVDKNPKKKSRPDFDFIILNEDESGLSMNVYDGSKIAFPISYLKQLVKYKGILYRVSTLREEAIYINRIYGSTFGCDFIKVDRQEGK